MNYLKYILSFVSGIIIVLLLTFSIGDPVFKVPFVCLFLALIFLYIVGIKQWKLVLIFLIGMIIGNFLMIILFVEAMKGIQFNIL